MFSGHKSSFWIKWKVLRLSETTTPVIDIFVRNDMLATKAFQRMEGSEKFFADYIHSRRFY